MAQVEPTVRAGILASLEQFLATRQVALRPLLARAGLTPADFEDPEARISLNSVATLLELAARQADDPCLGIHLGEYLPVGAGGLVGHLVMSAPTVRDALRSIERYVDLLMSPVTASYSETKVGAVVRWKYPETFTAERVQYSGLTMGALISRLRQAAGHDVRPRSAEFDHRPFDCAAEVRRLLGRNVRYNRPENALTFDWNTLRRSIAAETGLFGLIRQLGDRLLEEHRQEADVVEMTRRQIASHLRNGGSNLKSIAAIFGISARALQGRLRRSGTTFEELQTGVRREMAVNYLKNTNLTMTDIAHLLGFSELSAFTRAGQRWFKMSPRAYRAAARRRPTTRR